MLPIIPAPRGFRIFSSPHSDLLLVYRPNGMKYLLIFSIICLLGWMLFCMFIATLLITSFMLTQNYLISILTFLLFFVPFVLYFFAAKIFNQVYIILYFCLGRLTFDLRFDRLIFIKSLGILKKQKQEIMRPKIQYVQQIQTSGFQGNRFLSWGLLIKTANQDYHLLSYQSDEKTQWLGHIIAAWAKVNYLPSLKK